MNVKEFRAAIDAALIEGGFAAGRLAPRVPTAWTLSGAGVVPVFYPDAMRRPWGYKLSGSVGIELPELRRWLKEHKGGDGFGVFRWAFVTYNILNDPPLSRFAVTHDEQTIPTGEWIAKVRCRLQELPATVDELIRTYCEAPATLGWWASDRHKAAWDFLLRWRSDPDPSMPVPT